MRPGYVSTLSVIVLSAIMLTMVASSFRFSLQSQQVQKKTQIRIDYSQKEQALMRATIGEVTNAAMRCMMSESNAAAWQTPNRWRWIFETARNKADGETALESTERGVLGIAEAAISGNTGDGSQDHIVNNITATLSQSSEHMFYINGGTNSTGQALGSDYPEALMLSNSVLEMRDRDRPIITYEKTYADGSQFKALPYPNVHFGYREQGQTFIAKRNWWAFSMDYGKLSENQTGVKTHKRDYVLSIYEVPSQLGLSGMGDVMLGQHADGTAWQNITIEGSVFAERATLKSVALEQLAVRRNYDLDSASTLGGLTRDSIDGTLQGREEYEASHSGSASPFYPLSTAGDSGNVAFVSINRGEDMFDALSNTLDTNSASPTGWNLYSRPAMQCKMVLRVEDVYSATDQTPTSISFRYKMGGIDTTETFTAGVNWPTAHSAEGATFPFHLEETPYGQRKGITVYVERLADYLAAQGADSLDINNSLLVDANYRDNANIWRPNIPSLSEDISLIIRNSKDLTAFTKGFSMVTPFRMYLAGDLNQVSSGTGPTGDAVYPPVSLFAPEKRFGLRKEEMEIRFAGQLNELRKDGGGTTHILDLPSGENEVVDSDNIHANLFTIDDPSQLPPINHMNWLVVIEEVH